jgi:hypothetical protein
VPQIARERQNYNLPPPLTTNVSGETPMANRDISTNSEDLTDSYNPLVRESTMSDITEAKVQLNVRNLVLGSMFLFLTGGGGTAAWLDLKSDVKAAITKSNQNNEQIIAVRCDVFYIRNTIQQTVNKLPALSVPKECQ